MKVGEERLRTLPDRPGVYLLRDGRGQILYVGKAKRLRLRIRSYFRKSGGDDERLERLRGRIADVDTIVTGNEVEALILEANLIKRYRPPFNIELKDDKRYPFLKLSLAHPFPGLVLTRRVLPDGARYFGPYTHVKNLRYTLRTLRKVFPLRNCSDRRLERDSRECLEYFIARCPAPCTGRIEAPEYRRIVDRLVRFLEGDVASVVEDLRTQMRSHAESLRFEEAARLRNDIATLERLILQQRMTPALGSETDVLAVVARGDLTCGVALHVREGKVLGKEHRILRRTKGRGEAEVLRAFLLHTYIDAVQFPDEIVVGTPIRDAGTIEAWLAEAAQRPIGLRRAARGVLGKLVGVARENAHLLLEEEELRARTRRTVIDAGVYDLQARLALARTPYSIEGYDVSNLHATFAVASRVTFRDGKPWKGGYRRYRIKRVTGPDDIAMIAEVLARRLGRLKEEGEAIPDLILVDGGAGQVARAAEVLAREGLEEIQLLGLAKRNEEVVPRGAPALRLPRNSAGLRLLQRVRDEAHRFALGYHRTLRTREQTRSALEEIAGIGPKRRAILLRYFGSLAAMREAGEVGLARVPGIGSRQARRILEGLERAEGNRNRRRERTDA